MNTNSNALSLNHALQNLEQQFPNFLEELKTLARIPSVSFEGYDPKLVRDSAQATAKLLTALNWDQVELLEVPGAHPYVYAEKISDPTYPTLLLYAHHDVQPPGILEKWKTPPFEPTAVQTEHGLRLFGRGTADDKAGIIVHAASFSCAFQACLKNGTKMPVNLKLVVEGEEETGSDHLPLFLETYRSRLDADVLVLTDTSNFDVGVPALTAALRGLVSVELEMRALKQSLHSGMWGGPLPDPVLGLSKVLSSLVDDKGQIAIPKIRSSFSHLTSDERVEFEKIPYNESLFRKQSGLVPSASLVPPLQNGVSPWVQIWREPSLTVTAIQASSRASAPNIINDTAWAKVTVRTAPEGTTGLSGSEVLAALLEHLKTQTPFGLEMNLLNPSSGNAWQTETTHPYFEKAKTALKKGYGVEPRVIGCGGSIPFVQPFAKALGGVPALLVGVEDPYTNAHGENESLCVEDLKSAIRSQIELYWQFANE